LEKEAEEQNNDLIELQNQAELFAHEEAKLKKQVIHIRLHVFYLVAYGT
jgi:hypothetical protein